MFGKLAKATAGVNLPLVVLESHSGFYLGTAMKGIPFSRESEEYFAQRSSAEAALKSGNFTQRLHP